MPQDSESTKILKDMISKKHSHADPKESTSILEDVENINETKTIDDNLTFGKN